MFFVKLQIILIQKLTELPSLSSCMFDHFVGLALRGLTLQAKLGHDPKPFLNQSNIYKENANISVKIKLKNVQRHEV